MDGVDDVSLNLHDGPLAQLSALDPVVHLCGQHAGGRQIPEAGIDLDHRSTECTIM